MEVGSYGASRVVHLARPRDGRPKAGAAEDWIGAISGFLNRRSQVPAGGTLPGAP